MPFALNSPNAIPPAPTLKRWAAGIRNWTEVDADHAEGEFFAKLQGCDKEASLVVVRERVREAKEAVGRKRIDVPGYTFRIYVTNRPGEPLELWRERNKRAVIEQRIEGIKAELHADGFRMKDFFATESAFLAVLFTFNLLSTAAGCPDRLPTPPDSNTPNSAVGKASSQVIFRIGCGAAPHPFSTPSLHGGGGGTGRGFGRRFL